MSFYKDYSDPDGSYLDSTPRGNIDNLVVNNSSNYKKNTNKFRTDFGYNDEKEDFSGFKKINGMYYPKSVKNEIKSNSKNNKTKQKKTQIDFIELEKNYKPKIKIKKSKVIDHYETLCWYFDGVDIKKKIIEIDIGSIFQKYNPDISSCVIRNIKPICSNSTLDGGIIHVNCIDYPVFNICTFNSNIDREKKSYFANIPPGSSNFKNVEKIDIVQLSKESPIDVLLSYKDDDEEYPFRDLVKEYNNLYSREKVNMRKKYGEHLPKNGINYLQEIVDISNHIPSGEIDKMDSVEYEKDNFKIHQKTNNAEMAIVNPSNSYYYQFASRCPFYEAKPKLLYFTKPPRSEIVGKIGLPRHKALMKVLRLLKKERGIIGKVRFEALCWRKMETLFRVSKPNCVTLKICFKITV
jgi:hypothetical protein